MAGSAELLTATGRRADSRATPQAAISSGAAANSVRNRLIRGVAWNVAGSIAQQGGCFAGTVMVARILGRQTFGEFALIQSSLVALTTIGSLALGVTATKYVSEYRGSQPERAGRILGLVSAAAIVAALATSLGLLLAGSHWIPGIQANESQLWGARIGAAYVFFITLNGYQLGAVAGFEAFRTVGLISVVYGISNLLLSCGLASLAGLRGAVAAQAVSAFLLWAMYQVAVRSECRGNGVRITYRNAWKERGVLLRFSLPGAACGIVGSVAMWWCNAFLVRTGGYAELAVFSAVNNMRSMVLFLPAIVARVSTPLLNRLRSGGNHCAYRRTLLGSTAVNAAIALPLAAGLVLGGEKVLGAFGRDFSASRLLTTALLSSAVLEVIGSSLFQALFSSGRIWWNLVILSVWATVLTAAARVSTPAWGAAGLAVSYLLAWCVAAALYAIAAWSQNRKGERDAAPERDRS